MGDPFEEKRLIEACLELLDTKLVVGIQDLGGAGLACATSETAGRGGVGMDVDVSAVPRREDGMEPWEVMTSESQERMLAIVTPESWPEVARICAKWEVRATVIGVVTEPEPDGGGRLRIRDGLDGPILADVPAASLSDDAPLYDRPRQAPSRRGRTGAGAARRLRSRPAGAAALAALGLRPVRPPAVPQHRGRPGRRRRAAPPGRTRSAPLRARRRRDHRLEPAGLRARPARGTALVLAEGVANLACVGATPVAVVNCLNFGNPEHPEVMWQLSECIDGMAEACRALDLPVIGGNVSLYNESGGADIDPTPVLGLLGLVDAVPRPPPGLAWSAGDTIVLLGPRAAVDSPPRSRARAGPPSGATTAAAPPAVDFAAHAAACAFVAGSWPHGGRPGRAGATDPLVRAVHDVSGGGLAVALAEMAAASALGCPARARRRGRALRGGAVALRGGQRRPRRAVRPGRGGGGRGGGAGPGRRRPVRPRRPGRSAGRRAPRGAPGQPERALGEP